MKRFVAPMPSPRRPPMRPPAVPSPLRHALARTALAALLCCVAGGAVAAPGGDKAARFYEDALVRYEAQDMPGAIIQLKNALQVNKDLLPVHVLLGKALLANSEVGAAEVALLEALRLGVNRAEVVVPLAQAYVGQGKQKLLLDERQFDPAGLPRGVQFDLLLLHASAAADLGKSDAALRLIEQARALDASSPRPWLAEVPIRIRSRQFREAESAAAKVLAMAPGSAEGWYQKGSIAHVQGDLKSALAAYDKALSLEPDHVEARVTRAGLLLDMGQADAAAKDVAELRRVSPKEPRGAYLNALLAERRGDAEAAANSLREVTALLDPVPLDFIRYRTQLLMLNGLAHFGLNQREKAKAYLETFQKVQGHSAASKILARLYLADRNVPEAMDVLQGYLRRQPGDPQALTLLASAHMARGEHAKATALMQEALRNHEAPQLRTALGLTLLGGGKLADATSELEAAYKKDPRQTQAGSALVGLYLRGGKAAQALAVAQSLVQQQPANASFHNLLGLARARGGDTPGAKAAFEKALSLAPGQPAPQFNLARLDMAAKAYDSAAARLGAVLKANQKDIDALLEMAALSDLRGQPAEAQRWLEKANDFASASELRPGFALLELHLRENRPDQALEASKQLLVKAREQVPVLLAHARVLMANGDTAGARTTLNNATRLAAFEAPAQVDIAGMQLRIGNLPGAAYSLEKALSSQPDYLPALALMTEVETRQGEHAKSEQRAREIIQREPRRAIGYTLLGDVALARGQGAAAVAAYRQAHQAEPSTGTLLRLYRASLGPQTGKSALALAEDWLKSHPRDLPVRKALADGHAALGNFAAARSAYEEVLKSTPGDAETLNNLANVLLRQKDPAALAMAERALAAAPANPLVIDTAGWISFHHGQTDRALQLLRDARLRAPDNGEIRYHLATVLAKAGRAGEAKAEAAAALASAASADWRGDAEALLKTLQ